MATYQHEFLSDFIVNYNIRNGELANQTKLNESVNALKKEVDDLYNKSQIINGKLAFDWQPQQYYTEGEIVSYNGNNFKVKDLKNNTNQIPYDGSEYWELTERSDYTISLDPGGYLNKNNTTPYIPAEDYNPSTKKYVDESVLPIYSPALVGETVNFLKLDRVDEYTPTAEYHPSTKKYVDDSLQDLASGGSITVGLTEDSNRLGKREASEYITLENKLSPDYMINGNPILGMSIKNGPEYNDINSSSWIRTTASGLLPYDKNTGSNLGSALWKFNEVYCKTLISDNLNLQDITATNIDTTDLSANSLTSSLIGTDILTANVRVQAPDMFSNEYHTPNADIAEKYETDKDYDLGTVLGIGQDTEVTEYKAGMILAGVVSKSPGFGLNSDIDGIYIALNGRVPCKISGSAKRGQYINADDNGYGVACDFKTDRTIGVCLKDDSNIVEVKI